MADPPFNQKAGFEIWIIFLKMIGELSDPNFITMSPNILETHSEKFGHPIHLASG